MLNFKLNWINTLIVILVVFSLLAPLISTSNPNLIKDLGQTKLLPPLSSIIVFEQKKASVIKNKAEKFKSLKNNVINHGITKSVILIKNDKNIDKIEILGNIGENKIDKNIFNEISSKLFLFGTDEYGRDVFARIIYGTRLAMIIGLGSILVSLLLGITLGVFSGFIGGIVDSVTNRITEMFLAFPFLFLIILIIALFGNSVWVVILVLGISGWMSLFKIIRNEIKVLQTKDFIITSKYLGISNTKIFFKEMFPILIPPIIVNLVLQFGNVIMAESALSYLGLGVGEEYSSWGSMISAGQYYLTSAWWMSLFPSLFLFFALYSANYVGRNLEKLFNPLTSE